MPPTESEKLDKLLETVARIEKRGEKIELAVLGNEELEIDGLVDKVKRHERYIDGDKKLKAKIAGGVAVGTPVLVILWERIQHWLGWK